jgi:hypothetical protein
VEEIVMGENGHRNRSSLNLADLGTWQVLCTRSHLEKITPSWLLWEISLYIFLLPVSHRKSCHTALPSIYLVVQYSSKTMPLKQAHGKHMCSEIITCVINVW